MDQAILWMTPYHTVDQDEIECYPCSLKTIVKLQQYFSPSPLVEAVDDFVEYYNNTWFRSVYNPIVALEVSIYLFTFVSHLF